MKSLTVIALFFSISVAAQQNFSFTAYSGGIRPGLSGFEKSELSFESASRFLIGSGLSYKANNRFEFGVSTEYHLKYYTLLVKDCNCRQFIDDFSSIAVVIRSSYSLLDPARRSRLLLGGGMTLMMDYGVWDFLRARDSSNNYLLEQSYRFNLYAPYLLAFGSLSYEYKLSPVFRFFADLRIHSGIYNSGNVKDVRINYQNNQNGVSFDRTFRFNHFDKYLTFGFKYNLFGKNHFEK